MSATLLTSAHPLSGRDIELLASQAYGLEGEVSLLSGERDQTFLLRQKDGAAFVVKAVHPAEDPGVIDFQTQVHLHLMRQARAPHVPAVLMNAKGAWITWHVDHHGTERAIRVMNFIDGRPLHLAGTSQAQREAVGAALASLVKALADFDHPQAKQTLLWDVRHAGKLVPMINSLASARQVAIARYFLARFLNEILPRMSGLRSQVIHNDLNKYNMLVDPHDDERIAGVLDFGDMVHAPIVQDIAVACAYQFGDSSHPLEDSAQCAAAFYRHLPLDAAELDVLPDIMAARYLITVLITAWRAKRHPENSAYILRHNTLAWRALDYLHDIGMENAKAIFLAEFRGLQ